MIKKLLLIFTLVLSWTVPATAAQQANELWLKPLTLAQLRQVYDFYNYSGERGYLMLPSYHYPPIFLHSFPSDFATITDETERAVMFNKILVPLALKVNADIMAERQEIEALQQTFKTKHELSAEQEKWLETKATKYDIFTHLQGFQRTKYLLAELLVRVDAMPPSFLIATAALETDWGTSRIVKAGNALYKQLAWHTDSGLEPLGETEDKTYKIKTYPSLYAAMTEFALKLNSALAFEQMRKFRYELRRRGDILQGTTFSYSLLWNSPLKNYAGILEYTIAFYELNIIDKSILGSKIIEQPLPKNLQKLISSADSPG